MLLNTLSSADTIGYSVNKGIKMNPIAVSETIQEYKGVRYYLCGDYFQNNRERLHRLVYTDSNGEIPNGWHVHHIDHDRTNNSVENLELVEAGKHTSHHHLGVSKLMHPNALKSAAEWHRSEEGKAWHRKHYQESGKAMHEKTKHHVCSVCKKEYLSNKIETVYCSKNCKSQARRLSGIDNENRKCVSCKSDFIINKYKKTLTCSRVCGQVLTKENKLGLN
jgi:hypothetical protein